ncbi:MAG TPA: hypothetical protein VLV15_10760 [Dongiaceae bacterium]|nr:hypothetical protein [Dongiaceae bacterium]
MTTVPTDKNRRPPRSLHAEYQHFIDQRIEEYKDQLPRQDILKIGDEAVTELARSEQIQLTEMVLRDQVDAIIRKRLRLPSFRRWRDTHLTLRAAQAQPGHWGLAAHDPVVLLADRLEPADLVLVVGANDGACAMFLAAKGASVHVVDPDIAAVCGLENRAVTESLGGYIECEVVPLPTCRLDHVPFTACVIETTALAPLSTSDRRTVVDRLKEATPPGGLHAVMSGAQSAEAPRAISSETLRTLYADWTVHLAPGSGKRRSAGFIAINEGKSGESD